MFISIMKIINYWLFMIDEPENFCDSLAILLERLEKAAIVQRRRRRFGDGTLIGFGGHP